MHRVSPEARFDLDEIAFYISKVAGPPVAARIIAAITEKFYLLPKYPLLGRTRSADLGPGRRSIAVAPYVIIYRVEDGDVAILRVVHGRRDIASLLD